MNSRYFRSAAIVVALGSSALAQSNTISRVRIPHVSAAPSLQDMIRGAHGNSLEVTDFKQRHPLDGAPASRSTTAYVSYDDKNLYVAFLCRESRSELRAHMSKREDISNDDTVSVSLDTFHDGKRAYEFFSNPLGIQADAVISEGSSSDDFSFDTQWKSEGKLTGDGYAVLFSIPFRSLRFDASNATWGVSLGRTIASNSELSTWPQITERVEAYVPQFAPVAQPEGVSAGRNIQLTPYAFVSQQRFLDDNADIPGMKHDTALRGGLDAKMVLRDHFTIDATVNPDFSQIESDEPQVTTNQRYEVFFPEKRPFFLENADYFDTPGEELLFTRRIVDPQYGVRVSGKAGDWIVAGMYADDRAPGKLEPLGSPLRDARAENFAGRLQRVFSGSSNVGVLFTRRQFGGNSVNLVDVDARVKLNENWIVSGQAIQSSGRTLDGSSANGTAVYTEIRQSGRNAFFSSAYRERTANFAGNELGFFRRTDIRQTRNEFDYTWHSEGGRLQSSGPQITSTIDWDRAGQLQDWNLDVPMWLRFKGPIAVSAGRTESFERYLGLGFRKHQSYATFSSSQFDKLSFDASLSKGNEINFFPGKGILPFLGNSQDSSAGLTWRPKTQLRVEQRYIYSRLGIGPRAVFNDHLSRTKVNYQFTKALSLRAIMDYHGTLPNPALVDLTKFKQLNFDVLMTYLIQPGTAFYIGYSDRYENLLLDPLTGLQRIGGPNKGTSRQLFAKLSYAFNF